MCFFCAGNNEEKNKQTKESNHKKEQQQQQKKIHFIPRATNLDASPLPQTHERRMVALSLLACHQEEGREERRRQEECVSGWEDEETEENRTTTSLFFYSLHPFPKAGKSISWEETVENQGGREVETATRRQRPSPPPRVATIVLGLTRLWLFFR
eukprot:gene10308-7206_t